MAEFADFSACTTMFNSSQQISALDSSARRSPSPSSLLSSVINFNYSTDINTPPCLQSSDEDEIDDKLLSALMQDNYVPGSSFVAVDTRTGRTDSDGRRKYLFAHQSNSRFSANMSRAVTQASSKSSTQTSFIPRPVYHPQQKHVLFGTKPAVVVGNDTADRRTVQQDASENDKIDEKQSLAVHNKRGKVAQNEHQPFIPAVETVAATNLQKKYECFLMTGNRMVNKTPQLHFLPHIASAPGLIRESNVENRSVHDGTTDDRGDGNVLSNVQNSGALISSVGDRHDSPQLVDSAIPTATTTSSFNDDDEAQSTGQNQRHNRRNIGLRASLFRDQSSNSSAAGGIDAAQNTTKEENPVTSAAAAATTDEESGIDLPKLMRSVNDSSQSKTSSPAQHDGKKQQHATHAFDSSRADPILSMFAANDDCSNNILHETDILDAEPENPSNDAVNTRQESVNEQQNGNSTSFEDLMVNLSSNSHKTVPAAFGLPSKPVVPSSQVTEWNFNAVAGCPLPDILNNCHNQHHEQHQMTSPMLAWYDIESASGDTIAIIGSGNCGFSAGRQKPISNVVLNDLSVGLVEHAISSTVAAENVKNAEVADREQQNVHSGDEAMPKKKLGEDRRPVWTFNAPSNNNNDNNVSLEEQAQTPAPTGYGVTTRSVPASPATYRRATGGGGGGSLSSGGGKRIGRALMMHRGGGGLEAGGADYYADNNSYIGSRSHQYVTVMPFLRLKSPSDNGGPNVAAGGGVTPSAVPTPSSNDTTLKSLARSLYYLKGCTPVEVADHIVEDAELKHVYLNLHNFSGLNLEIGLRQFLEKVCLIGTPQQKGDLLERFARRFYYTYDEEFENWLHRSEMAKNQEDGVRSTKPQFSTLSSLSAGVAAGDDTSVSISAYFTTDRQPSNNSNNNNKLFVSIRTTFFASLALVMVSSYFYQQQQQLASNSGSTKSTDRDSGSKRKKSVADSDAVDLTTGKDHHVRERHAAGSRHPKPGCLDHLPSISAYTVRYEESDEEDNQEKFQQKPARKTSATKSITNRDIPVVIKTASELTSTDANRLWNALFNELLPADERVPSREQNRLKTSICKEPLPVKLTENEIELLYQLACRYEPPSVDNEHEQNQRPESASLDAVKVNDAGGNTVVATTELPATADEALMAELLAMGDVDDTNDDDERRKNVDDSNLFVQHASAASPLVVSEAAVPMPAYWPPFKLFMESAFGEVMKTKQRCGAQGAHIKWWGRRWHRRLVELRDLMLIERRPSLARKPINDPKRQRADSEDIVVPLHHAWVERPTAENYPKHSDNPNVLQLFLHSGAIRLLRCDTEQQAQRWLRMINLNCAFSAPVKVPATNDPTCLLQSRQTNFAGEKKGFASSARSDMGPYETVGHAAAAGGGVQNSAMLMSNYTPPRFFPDAITTFNQHQQLAELRDYAARCEHDARVVGDEERELRQTRTLSLHASLRRSARRHTQRLLLQRGGALLLRKQLLATELRRTRVYIHALEQLIGGSGCIEVAAGGNAPPTTTTTAVKLVESMTVVKQSIK